MKRALFRFTPTAVIFLLVSVIGHSPILGVNNQNPPPPPTISGDDTLTVGDPNNASGQLTASGGTPGYSWSAPGLSIDATGDTVEISAILPGEYTVTVTDEDGEGVSSSGFTVTVDSVIEITGPEHIILDGSTGSASYSATGSEEGYTWDTENFPTGTTEGEDSIQLTVNQGGTFNVTAYGTVNGASVPSAPISVEVLGFEIEGPIRLSASEPPESLGYSLNGTYSNPSDFSWTTSHADIALMNPQNGDVSDLLPSPASVTTDVTITATHEPSGATATKSVEFVKIDIEGPSPVVASAINTYTYTATTQNYTVRLGANAGAMSSGTGIGVISAKANYGPTSHDIVAWLVLDTSITARKTVQINAPDSPPGEDPDGNDDDDDDPTPPPPTPTPTASPTPTPSPTPGSTPTPTPSPTPGSTPTPTPGSSPTPDPSPTPGPTPTPTPSPSPTPTPTPTPTPVPLPTPEEPILVYEVASGYQVKYGMPPFATPTPAEPTAEAPKRYLKLNASTSLEGGCPETPVGGTIERIIDPLDGSETENVTGNPSYYGVKDAESPTSYSGSFEVSSYDDPPNRERDCPGEMTVNATLDPEHEHTTEMLYDEVLEKIGDYYDQWTETPRSAYLDLSEDELTLFVQNLRYRWVFPDNDETYTVSWLEVFEPEDDPETEDVDESQEYVIVSKTKTHQGATSEDDDFYINPLERNESRDGRYFLIPITNAVVNRDDPRNGWNSEESVTYHRPIYAGELSGDMLEFRLENHEELTAQIAWNAVGPNGENLTGPNGWNAHIWPIHNQDEDNNLNWLMWNPGEWTISVQIGQGIGEFKQIVGHRTEDYVVVGQVVPTNTHDADAPRLWEIQYPNPNPDEFPGGFPALTSPVLDYRRALIYDMVNLPLIGNIDSTLREAMINTPLPITAKLAEAWFGYWYLNGNNAPKGPFETSYPLGLGRVEYGHRLWATQHIFNVSPDFPVVEESFDQNGFEAIRADEQYRLIQRYKAKFLVSSEGKIESLEHIHRVAETGPTKMNFGIAAGEFKPLWDNPEQTFFSLPTQPSEPHPENNRQKISQEGTRFSHFASGRVGLGGRLVNWRLMGKDAPWIFSEIVFELEDDGTVSQQFRISVDSVWSEDSSVEGEVKFNNMNVFKGIIENNEAGSYDFTFQLRQLLPMEGSLEGFINSASGDWPEPPVQPFVQ